MQYNCRNIKVVSKICEIAALLLAAMINGNK